MEAPNQGSNKQAMERVEIAITVGWLNSKRVIAAAAKKSEG